LSVGSRKNWSLRLLHAAAVGAQPALEEEAPVSACTGADKAVGGKDEQLRSREVKGP